MVTNTVKKAAAALASQNGGVSIGKNDRPARVLARFTRIDLRSGPAAVRRYIRRSSETKTPARCRGFRPPLAYIRPTAIFPHLYALLEGTMSPTHQGLQK
jgi:hypothetical protein